MPQGRLNEWNRLVSQIDGDVLLILEQQTRLLTLDADHLKLVTNVTSWDLVHACLEHEYADVVNTRFYRELAAWYLRGHLVCGMDQDMLLIL